MKGLGTKISKTYEEDDGANPFASEDKADAEPGGLETEMEAFLKAAAAQDAKGMAAAFREALKLCK